jgi:hypothetical protein
MRQYGSRPTGYTCQNTLGPFFGSKSYEAQIGVYYDRLARNNRRRMNAKDWYHHQIQSYGMPWQYHCLG